MKKSGLIFVLVCAVLVLFTACSIPTQKPHDGVWYCDELKVAIDFDLLDSEITPDCARLYSDDGSVTDILCFFDYGNGIVLTSSDQKTKYFDGTYSYKKDEFIVESNSDNKEYSFICISDESASDSNDVYDALQSIRAEFEGEYSYHISCEFMNFPINGFEKEINQIACEDGSFSFITSTRQWDHRYNFETSDCREFYYRYEDDNLMCYVKYNDGSTDVGKVEESVSAQMKNDRKQVIGADVLLPSYIDNMICLVPEEKYSFSLSVQEMLDDTGYVSQFLEEAFELQDFEYDETLDLKVYCIVQVEKSDGTYRPVKLSYNFDEVNPYVMSEGAISGEYALEGNFMRIDYEFDYSLSETVEIPEVFFDN